MIARFPDRALGNPGPIDLVRAPLVGERERLTRPRARNAMPTVLSEIKRHFGDKTWAMRVPGDGQESS